jgi:hypothetical protein
MANDIKVLSSLGVKGCLESTSTISGETLCSTGAVKGTIISGSSCVTSPKFIENGTCLANTYATLSGLNSKTTQSNLSTYTGATRTELNLTVTGGTNGAFKSGRNIKLGGVISEDTTVAGSHKLTLGKLNGIDIRTSGNTDILIDGQQCGGFVLKSQSGSTNTFSDFTNAVGILGRVTEPSGFSIYDNRIGANQTGIVYNDNYSGNYVDRSLVDKAYVDSVASGLNAHASVLAATTGSNITLSGLFAIDEITPIAGDRILVKNQTAGWLNGIYVTASGLWSRADDYNFAPSGEISNGDLIPVLSGTTNANSVWVLTTSDPIVSGDTLSFSKFSQSLGVSEGNGINITNISGAQQISVELSTNCGLTFNGSGLAVNSSIAGTNLTWTNGVLSVAPALFNAKASAASLATYTGTTAPATYASITNLNTKTTQSNLAAYTGATATAIGLKANSASPTFTGTVVLPSTTSIGTVTSTEIGYLDNVTSSIQTQLNSKTAQANLATYTGTTAPATYASIANLNSKASASSLATYTGTTAPATYASIANLNTKTTQSNLATYTGATATAIGLKANSASPTFTGTVVLPSTTSIGTVTNTEIGYLDNVTSSIQTQLNSKTAQSNLATYTGNTETIIDTKATQSNLATYTGATATAIGLKANTASPTFTGTVVLPSTTSIGNVTNTEIGYLDNVTSSIQTQLNSKTTQSNLATYTGATATAIGLKANTASPTFTGTVVLPSTTSIGTVSSTEIGYLDNVTSSIQTQLNSKTTQSNLATYTGTTAPATYASITNLNSKTTQSNLATYTGATATAIGLKANTASPTFTGTPLAPTPATACNNTTIATTAFVKAQGYSTSTGTVTSVAALTITTTGTDITSSVANGTTTPVITINIPTASSSNRGALSAADWTTFNNKTSCTGTVTSITVTAGDGMTGGGTVTTSGTVTLNIASAAGTAGSIGTINVAADAIGVNLGTTSTTASRGDHAHGNINNGGCVGTAAGCVLCTTTSGCVTAFTLPAYTTCVGTVTSVAALTITTTGTDITSSVANGGTTPVITLCIPTASAANRGALSAADWTTFNNKQAAITGGATTITTSNLTASRALVSDASGKVAVSTVTSTQLGYVDATSSIQTQLNAKALIADPSFTGVVTIPTSGSLKIGTTTKKTVSLTPQNVAVNIPQKWYIRIATAGASNIFVSMRVTLNGTYSNAPIMGMLTAEYGLYYQSSGVISPISTFAVTSTSGKAWENLRIGAMELKDGYIAIPVWGVQSNTVYADIEYASNSAVINNDSITGVWDSNPAYPLAVEANYQHIISDLRLTDNANVSNGKLYFRTDRSDTGIVEDAYVLTMKAPTGLIFDYDSNSAGGGTTTWKMNGVTKMTLDTDGNLGVGGTPSVKFEVAGVIRSSYVSDQIQLQSYNQTTKQWRLGTAIGNSGNNRNFTIWETDLGNAITISQSTGNVGIHTPIPTHLVTIGDDASNGTQYPKLKLQGMGVLSSGNYYGSYGGMLFNANNSLTAGARQYLITNGYGGSAFAIIRSVDGTTEPTLGDNGQLTSGAADFVISNNGTATFSSIVNVGANLLFNIGAARCIAWGANSAGAGSALYVYGNQGAATSVGGTVSILGGQGGATSGNGGATILTGGPAINGTGGVVCVHGGNAVAGAGGDAIIAGGGGTTTKGKVILCDGTSASVALCTVSTGVCVIGTLQVGTQICTPTPATACNNTVVATTAFVKAQSYLNWAGTTADGVGTYVSPTCICSEPNMTFNGTKLGVAGNICASTCVTSSLISGTTEITGAIICSKGNAIFKGRVAIADATATTFPLAVQDSLDNQFLACFHNTCNTVNGHGIISRVANDSAIAFTSMNAAGTCLSFRIYGNGNLEQAGCSRVSGNLDVCGNNGISVCNNIIFTKDNGSKNCITYSNLGVGNGSGLMISAQQGASTSTGGTVTILAGNGGSTSGAAGHMVICAGCTKTTTGGGCVYINGGEYNGVSTGTAGCVRIMGGTSTYGGGTVYICGGSGSYGGGGVIIEGGTGGSSDGSVSIKTNAQSHLLANPNSSLVLYYQNATKLCTVSNGICLGTNCGFAVDFVATSDSRLKTNIKPISNALSLVNNLCGIYYCMCDDVNNENRVGLLAQDVINVIPELVSHSEPSDEEKEIYGMTDEKLGLKYDKLTAVLVEAIKEQQKQIEGLKLEINNMKNNN